VAVVIPSYRVKDHILEVLGRIGPDVSAIYVVDDACPEQSGAFVRAHCRDLRVTVIEHPVNQGVGGATLTGIRAAIAGGADICVKIDGDGQMDPALLPRFIAPIIDGLADYTKGNRFFYLDNIGRMPRLRLVGNAALSFFAKLSTGYWDSFDPNNGYLALATAVARELPLDKISRRYFFESDMLFRLSLLRARILDIPMHAVYGEEKSSLKIRQVLGEFFVNHIKNLGKRLFYNYFLRDFSIASVYLVFGTLLLGFGTGFGIVKWLEVNRSAIEASSGTVMLAALPVILGFQLLLSFLAYDIANVPRVPLQRLLGRRLLPDGNRDQGAGGLTE
jgi:dolichol-phosphate mannosyltransferase